MPFIPVPGLKVPSSMRHFLSRLHPTVDHMDWGLHHDDPAKARYCGSIRTMRRILEKQRIDRPTADYLIHQTIEGFLNKQLEELRRADNKVQWQASVAQIETLAREFKRLAAAIAQLQPDVIRRLNGIALEHDPQTFDGEVLAAILDAIVTQLESMPDVAAAVLGPVGLTDYRAIGPELIHQWEMIPADVRLPAELKIRSRKRFTSIPQFLRQLAQLIHKPVGNRLGRPSRLTRQYLRAVATNWLALGLKVGRARGDERSSVFQQFCEAALAAIGDQTKITSQDIKNLKTALKR